MKSTDIIESIIIVLAFTFDFICILLLGYFGIKLKKGKETEVNMNLETLVVTIIWVTYLSCFYILFIYFEMYTHHNLKAGAFIFLALIILSRNISTFIISVASPVFITKEGIMIPYGETRECVNNVELTLSTVLPYKYFFAFIESTESKEDMNILALYTEIKLFEATAENEEFEEMNFQKAVKIMEDFIRPDGRFCVKKIKDEVRISLNQKFENIRENLNKHLFDSVYGIVINNLQGSFIQFKRSGFFKQLSKELRLNEIIFERLVLSQLI